MIEWLSERPEVAWTLATTGVLVPTVTPLIIGHYNERKLKKAIDRLSRDKKLLASAKDIERAKKLGLRVERSPQISSAFIPSYSPFVTAEDREKGRGVLRVSKRPLIPILEHELGHAEREERRDLTKSWVDILLSSAVNKGKYILPIAGASMVLDRRYPVGIALSGLGSAMGIAETLRTIHEERQATAIAKRHIDRRKDLTDKQKRVAKKLLDYAGRTYYSSFAFPMFVLSSTGLMSLAYLLGRAK